jgi:holo-[acyl-carrier protein] synthase
MIVGVGIDLVERSRVARSVERFGERLAARIMSEPERAMYAALDPDPVVALAMTIALKEAGSKAIGTGWSRGVAWRDVVVVPGELLTVRFENDAVAAARRCGSSGRTRAALTVDGDLIVGEVLLLS